MSNLKKLTTALFGEQVQDLEDKMREMFYRTDIDNSIGQQLSGLGSILGQDRLGHSDEIYKILLKVRIGVNVSESDTERILSVWKLLTGTDDVQLLEKFPAAIILTTTIDPGNDIGNLLIQILQSVTGAGISLENIEIWDTSRFGWGSGWGSWGTSNWITVYSI